MLSIFLINWLILIRIILNQSLCFDIALINVILIILFGNYDKNYPRILNLYPRQSYIFPLLLTI
mgnify:CR=1 FL=1